MFGGRLKRVRSGFHVFPNLISKKKKAKSPSPNGNQGLEWHTTIVDEIVEEQENDDLKDDHIIEYNKTDNSLDIANTPLDIDEDSKEDEPSFAMITDDISNIFEYGIPLPPHLALRSPLFDVSQPVANVS